MSLNCLSDAGISSQHRSIPRGDLIVSLGRPITTLQFVQASSLENVGEFLRQSTSPPNTKTRQCLSHAVYPARSSHLCQRSVFSPVLSLATPRHPPMAPYSFIFATLTVRVSFCSIWEVRLQFQKSTTSYHDCLPMGT